MSSPSKLSSPALPVHIVEDHHEALPHIYKAIARKKLPFTGSALLHFDAHPDLLSPDIHAKDIVNKEQLFSRVSIADWILPAVYMGHVSHMIWVKPPWALQIAEGRQHLCVGEDLDSGKLRVSSPLPYFISELLHVAKDKLKNTSDVPLDVLTFHPSSADSAELSKCAGSNSISHSSLSGLVKAPLNHHTSHTSQNKGLPQHDPFTTEAEKLEETSPPRSDEVSCTSKDGNSFESTKCETRLPSDVNCTVEGQVSPRKKIKLSDDEETRLADADSKTVSMAQETFYRPQQLSMDAISSLNAAPAWILDIDLDFFSTGNPYRPVYSEEQYKVLQRLYHLEMPQSREPEAIRECVEKRRQQLHCLEQLWTDSHVQAISQQYREQFHLDTQDESLIAEMKGMIGTIRNDAFIDPEYLHISGLLTELPVHTSSELEITGLVSTLYSYLRQISKTPTLVTISRSADDEYTPESQVDSIQQQVLLALQRLYGNQQSHDNMWAGLDVQHHYRRTERVTSEPPGDICDCTYL